MQNRDITIGALDLLFLFVVMFLLAFLAVRYDAEKGLGEKDYVKINRLFTEEGNVEGDISSLNFMAIVLNKESIEVYRYDSIETKHVKSFETLEKFVNDIVFDENEVWVIYEREKSSHLSDFIRFFLVKGVPIGIAQVAI